MHCEILLPHVRSNIIVISSLFVQTELKFLEKNSPRKEGHPPSQFNSTSVYMRNKNCPICPSQELTTGLAHALSRVDLVNPAGQAKVFMWRIVALGRRLTLSSKGVSRRGRSAFELSQLIVSLVNGSPSFVRKCRKSWIPQGSLDRRVTLPFGTSFPVPY